jgi:hypothetical protein
VGKEDSMIAQVNGYSSDLEAFLCVATSRLPLAELGPDYCVVRGATELPPSDGEIVLMIDGEESRIPIVLPNGVIAAQSRVPYQSRAS